MAIKIICFLDNFNKTLQSSGRDESLALAKIVCPSDFLKIFTPILNLVVGSISGSSGNSAAPKPFIVVLEPLLDIFKFVFWVSKFIVSLLRLFIYSDNNLAGTVILPNLSTLPLIEVFIPISKFVVDKFKTPSFVSSKTLFKIGKVWFFPTIWLTICNPFLNFQFYKRIS